MRGAEAGSWLESRRFQAGQVGPTPPADWTVASSPLIWNWLLASVI
jgi:hypothetical protein